jgi:aminoglycoside phosphotransferase (APT) family kinase protein
LVPESEVQIGHVLETVRREASGDPAELRPVHGDLYEAQVYVADDFSLGLIDLDDVGLGDPAMDAANFCAHLLALALSVRPAAGRLLAYRKLARRAFADALGISERALDWRESLAMLLLATGPFRVADPNWPQEVRRRVDLAVRLLGGDRGGR